MDTTTATTPLNPELVRRLFSYDLETGELTWRKRYLDMISSQRACNTWNSRFSGKRAGACVVSQKGYRSRDVSIYGRTTKEHTIIWVLMTGRKPVMEIDHVNGDASDNRWSNLREASRSMNCKNMRLYRNNTSGISGVLWNPAIRKWAAVVRSKGKPNYLGSFKDKEDAGKAVKKFRSANGFTERHGEPCKSEES